MSAPPQPTQPRSARGLEQVVEIETPEQVVFSYTVAGIGSRAAAALVDYGIMLAAFLTLLALYVILVPPSSGAARDVSAMRRIGGWAVALLVLAQFVVQWGYYVLFEALADGQTPGKRWLGLRVVQDGGYSISFAASAARNIARIIDMQPAFFYLVGLAAVAVSRTGKRLGDQLAGTIVVRERILSEPAGDDGATRETGAGQAARAEPAPLTAALTDEELELLRRFLDRAAAIQPEHREALEAQLVTRLAAHLPAEGDRMAALRALRERELAARALGVGARGDTGASRELYALIREGRPRWSRFARKLAAAQRRGLRRMSGDEVADFVADYREIAADLARLSTAARGGQSDTLFRLSRLVAGGHNLLYRRRRIAAGGVLRFLFVAVPGELRRSARPILAAAVLLFGSATAAYVAVVRDPALVEQMVPAGMIDRADRDARRARAGDLRYVDIENYARPIVASAVFSNNAQVTFLAFASGLTAGVFTVLLLLTNGLSIGAAVGLFQTRGVVRLILEFVIAHSVFELSAICIAGGAGFIIAGALLMPGARTRGEALVAAGRRALRLLAIAVLLLVFAGTFEGLVSPRTDLGLGVKLGFAGASALLLALYASLGRGAAQEEDAGHAPKPHASGSPGAAMPREATAPRAP